jgi:hypothetical protein
MLRLKVAGMICAIRSRVDRPRQKSSQLDGTKSLRTRRRYAHLGPEGASRRQWRCWTKNLLAQAFSTGELRFPNYLSSKSLGA